MHQDQPLSKSYTIHDRDRLKVATENDIAIARARFPGSTRVLGLEIVLEGMLPVAQPRATVIQALLPARLEGLVFRILAENGRSLAVLYASTFVFSIPALLAFVSIIDYSYGYLALFVCLSTVPSIATLNVDLFVSLLKSFDFWVLQILGAVALAGLVDAFRANGGRVCVIAVLWLCNGILLLSDARYLLGTVTRTGSIVVCLVVSSCNWVLIILWNCGQLKDIQQRIVQVGTITIDFQSIAISCFVTYATLILRYTWLFIRHPESLLILKPRVTYVLIQEESRSDLRSGLAVPAQTTGEDVV